jgi:putative hydrolase of HD superfamily
MSDSRLSQQLRFVRELDALKQIVRRNQIGDGSRRENSAEHSWHLATMVLFLAEHFPEPLDNARALEMALIHDVIEIDAGDTFVYGTSGLDDKEERETRAAERLFALLPEDQRDRLWALWRDFETSASAEARFVRVLDRLQPVLLHQMTGGRVWAENSVTQAQVLERVAEIREFAPALWPTVRAILDSAIQAGTLTE